MTFCLFIRGPASMWAVRLFKCYNARYCSILLSVLAIMGLFGNIATAQVEVQIAPGRAQQNTSPAEPPMFLDKSTQAAQGAKFFAGCTIVPRTDSTPMHVYGKCLGHTFSKEGLTASDGGCRAGYSGGVWGVNSCIYDGKEVDFVVFYGDSKQEKFVRVRDKAAEEAYALKHKGENEARAMAIEKAWLLHIQNVNDEANKFFAGCTIIPGGIVEKTYPNRNEKYHAKILPQISGSCRNHTFAVEGFPKAEVPDDCNLCQIELHELSNGKSYWNISYCKYDGEIMTYLTLTSDTGRNSVSEKWLNAEQRAEAALTPKQRSDGPTLTHLYSPQGIPGAPTDEEALKIVSAIVNEHWQKCGDKYLSTEYLEVQETLERIDSYQVIASGNTAVEFAGVNIEIEREEVDTAAKLNGIQWIGNVSVTSEAYRNYMPPSLKKWGGTSWGSWNSGGTLIMTRLMNVNGVWKYSPTIFNYFTTAGHPAVYDLHMYLKTFYGPKPLSCEKRPSQ